MSIAPSLRPVGVFDDWTIDSCISYSKALITQITELYQGLYRGSIQSEELKNRYAQIYPHLQKITQELKPAAYAKCYQMRYEDGAPAKAALDTVTGSLKQRHRILLTYITDLFHDGKIQFPTPLVEPACFCSKPRAFLYRNIGKISWLSTVFISCMTLTPLGNQIGPILAEIPEYLGSKCHNIGAFFTKILSSDTLKTAAQSNIAIAIGKVALIPAIGVPTIWYCAKPVQRQINIIANKMDKTITLASQHPLYTFLSAWTIYYCGSRFFGFEGEFAEKWMNPFHARLVVTFGAAIVTPAMIRAVKLVIDSSKEAPSALPLRRAMNPLTSPISTANPIAQEMLPDLPRAPGPNVTPHAGDTTPGVGPMDPPPAPTGILAQPPNRSDRASHDAPLAPLPQPLLADPSLHATGAGAGVGSFRNPDRQWTSWAF